MAARRKGRVASLVAGSITVACLIGATGGVALADDSEATPPGVVVETPQTRDYCSGNVNYYPTWGVYNRQGVTNNTNPNALWFYQDGKVGPSAAKSGGNWATGGKGRTYCGNNFAYSTSSKL